MSNASSATLSTVPISSDNSSTDITSIQSSLIDRSSPPIPPPPPHPGLPLGLPKGGGYFKRPHQPTQSSHYGSHPDLNGHLRSVRSRGKQKPPPPPPRLTPRLEEYANVNPASTALHEELKRAVHMRTTDPPIDYRRPTDDTVFLPMSAETPNQTAPQYAITHRRGSTESFQVVTMNGGRKLSTSSVTTRNSSDQQHMQQYYDAEYQHAQHRQQYAQKLNDVAATPKRLSTFGQSRETQPATELLLLSETSSSHEVAEWLRLKGFSSRMRGVLAGQTGATLMALEKNQIIDFCGRDEGQRLFSQLLVLKNLTGFKTKSGAELSAILKIQRGKAEISPFNSVQNLFDTTDPPDSDIDGPAADINPVTSYGFPNRNTSLQLQSQSFSVDSSQILLRHL